MEASWRKANDGNGMVKWRLHTHFEILRGVPTRIDVTPNGGGEHDERAVLAAAIESDRLYVTDRGYAKFTLFNQIVGANSSYVCRLRDNSVWTVLEENYRNDDADLDEIISDELVGFSKDSGLNHKVRVICIRVNPHTSRGKYRGGSSGVDSDGILRIATSLLDVPAEVIGLIFSNRWAVEIFFRFFKHILGCRHLLSHDQNGIEIQTFCAIIACMLIALWTGKKPTLRTYEMICFYFTGLADEDELMTHIEKLKPQDTWGYRDEYLYGISRCAVADSPSKIVPASCRSIETFRRSRCDTCGQNRLDQPAAVPVPNTIGTASFSSASSS